MALGQDFVIAGVAKKELPRGEDVVELIPVVVEDLTVLVVLGPDVREQLTGAVPQFRPLAVAHNLRVHLAIIGIRSSFSDRISFPDTARQPPADEVSQRARNALSYRRVARLPLNGRRGSAVGGLRAWPM
jgi:hypothetical protein